MSNRNLQSQNSQNELNEVLNNSPTLLFLQGQISFQDYQNYVENQRFQNEFSNQTELVNSNVVEISIDSTSGEISNGQTPKTSGYKRQKTVSESSSSSTLKKKARTNDDDIESMIEMEVKAVIGESDDDDYEDNDDEATRWKDFDIETLNFDKFISDYSARSTSGDSADEAGKGSPSKSKPKQIDVPTTSGFGKRKKGDKNADPSELRTKRRVRHLISSFSLYFFRRCLNVSVDSELESVIEYCLLRYKA